MAGSGLAVDSSAKSRRGFLLGGLAGVAALLGEAVAHARPALAANGDAISVGGSFAGAGETIVEATGDEIAAFTGRATGSGSAGVAGITTTAGGEPAGLYGNATSATGISYGVFGRTKGDRGTAIGARAVSPTGPTFGLNAVVASPDGVGVRTESASGKGVALHAVGRVRFSTAGIATIAKGTKRVLVNPNIAIGSSSKVLCTLQSSPGGTTTVQRVAMDAAADRFTIYLTANATAATKVAWFVID